MPAFIVGTIHVTEPEVWQRYVDRVHAAADIRACARLH